MAWHDFIGISGLDTSLTDEEISSLPPPEEPDPDDLTVCPAQYYEVFTGMSGGLIEEDEEDDGETPETPEDISAQLQSWLNAVEQWLPEEEAWLDAARLFSEEPEGSRGDLPAPIPPQIPDLVDFVSLPALIAQFGPWGVVVFVGIRVAKRILEAWIEKKTNPGIGELKEMLQDIRDALKKGLLYNDGDDSTLSKAFLFGDGVEGANAAILKAGLLFADTDGEQKGALDRGLLKEVEEMDGDPTVRVVKGLLELLQISVQDLSYTDAKIMLGNFAMSCMGKYVEHT
jgi:hypothetical protein